MKKSAKAIAIVNATALSLLLVQGCTSTDGRTAGWGPKKPIEEKKTGWDNQPTGGTTEWTPTGGETTQPATSERVVESVYTVVKHDTLGDIALRHGVTWRELADFNNLVDPNKLYVNQRLEIPPPTRTPKPAGSTRSGSSGGGNIP